MNFVVVRENTEGLYSGAGGFHRKGTPHEVAVPGVDQHPARRRAHRALRLRAGASPARRRKLTLVHKTNVLTFAGDLYQRVVDEVAAEYPGVETDYVHVDAACIYFLDWPARFDVIVTDNMFGDIITDLGAMIQGGMGIAAGGNINPAGVSMFEPIGGTAPDHTGKGTINPLAAIGADGDAAAPARRDRGRRARRPRDPARRTGKMRSRCAPARWASRTTEVGDLVVEGRDGVTQRRRLAGGAVRHDAARRRAGHRASRTRSRTACGSCTRSTSSACPYIEGGWPGANPRDTEFFKLATKETLQHATLTVVRHDAPRGRARRGQRRAPRAARRRHRGRVPGRQVLRTCT